MPQLHDLYRWVWLVLTALALVAYAHATRYVPHVANDQGLIAVWDRWRHRMCWMSIDEKGGAGDCYRVPATTANVTPIPLGQR